MAITARGKAARLRAQQTLELRRELEEELEVIRTSLQQAHAIFNSVSDPDLVESWVYEINSLQARHCYLLRQIREICGPCPETAGEEARA